MRRASLIIAAVLAGCAPLAQTPRPDDSVRADKAWPLEGVYDRKQWRWMSNKDGRRLLTHAIIPNCFVDPAPEQDFREPGFRMQASEKTLGGTRYRVVTVYEGRDFWQASYTRGGSGTPLVGTYAAGPCQAELERLIETYEKRRSRAADTARV